MAGEAVKVPFIEAAAPATPAAGRVVIYAKSDGLLYSKDDAGTETLVSGGAAGSGIPATLLDAKGDLIAASAADTAARLAVGANHTKLVAASGETTGLAWVGFIGAKVYNSGTQNTSGATAVLTLDTELFDTNAFHDTGSNTSRFTIPTGYDGKYRITGFSFASAAADWIVIQKNGTTKLRGAAQNVTAAGRWHVCTIESLVATDYVEILVSSAGSVDWGFGAGAIDAQTTFMIEFLGP